jgi:hypothetical protein
MQFGKSLVGALIGGVLGIALVILVHYLTGWDKAWLAIPVALLTGLGVRWMVATHGHPSYARGALTGIIAILAFLASYPIIAQLTTRGSVARPITRDAAAPPRADVAADALDPAADEPASETPADQDEEPATDVEEPAADEQDPDQGAAPPPSAEPGEREFPVAGAPRNPRPQEFSTWDFVWLCISALIGYELGRGSGTAPIAGTSASRDGEAPPA